MWNTSRHCFFTYLLIAVIVLMWSEVTAPVNCSSYRLLFNCGEKKLLHSHSVYVWLGGVAVECRTCDQQVAGSNPSRPAVECNPGQVVNTHVPL